MASVRLPTLQDCKPPLKDCKPPLKVSQFAKRPPRTPRGELDEVGVDAITAASSWATATRRNIDMFLESELSLPAEELEKFIKEVSSVFIAALQRDSIKQWQYLNEVLKIIQPYNKLLNNNSQLKHYIERAVYRARKMADQDLANEILRSINKLFPKSLIGEKQRPFGEKQIQGDRRNYRSPTPHRDDNENLTGKANVSFTLPDGSHPYRFNPATLNDVTMRPKGISFGDISDAMPVVIQETVRYDAIWSEGLGLTAAALSTKFPATKSEVLYEERIPPLQPDAPAGTKDAAIHRAKVNTKATKEPVSRELTPMTGKEVVELFGKGRHLGKAKFVYLNKAKTRHFRPYDLIEVKQHKANTDEHWIVSCFGIMHKVEGQPAESMALCDWHRQAVLWSAMMKIPFFKYFLVRKAFCRWRANQKFNDFSSTRQRVESRLLQAIPRFGTSLLQISKLLQELRLLKLLPLEPNHCFALSEFDFTVLQKFREGKLILGKFFNFCKMILDKTCNDSIEKLKFCERQTKLDKAVFSKESLYVQRQKKEHREKNLAMAQEEASCLGNFVLLVDQILVSHLLALTRINICSFVENSMAAGPDCNREALFTAKLIFTKDHHLTLFPDKDKFRANLKQTLDNIPALITEMAKPMTELTTGLILPLLENNESSEAYELTTGTTPDPSKLAIELEEPHLEENARPRKSRDNLGVATPKYCIGGLSRADLGIVGERMIGQYNPISHGNLLNRLSQDEKVIAARLTQASLLDLALADVDAFCDEHSWLSEIHQFVKSWNEASATAWRRAQAFRIEGKLAEIRDWTEKVRNVDRMFITNNALFLVDCDSVQTDLVPHLDRAFKDLLNFTASEALKFSGAFTKEIKAVVADMKTKNPDMASFADYAQQYHTYKNKMAELQTEVEYIKSLFEVIRLSYRSLTPEEETNEEQVWQNWEAFLLQLQDAAEFVHVQMPVKTEELNATFQRQMAEAKKIFKEATSGVYLDPTQDSTKLLSSVLKLFDNFYLAQSEITKCNAYREKMHGKPYDMAELNNMLSLMRVRVELWKYLEASAATIQDWKLKVFKKFDGERAIDKLTEWQRAAGHLKQYLPEADPVLTFWYKMLADFKQHLPLLLKLSTDALKPRHWRGIFLAVGQTYEQNKLYRVMDFLSYNITEKSSAINKICSGAMAEFALEKSLVKLRQVWEEKDLKLAKHLIKGGQALASMGQPDVFILIGVEELKYLLEDSQVSFQNMLVSPHLADLRPSAELWRSTLSQVDEIVELIRECQSKWLYLYKTFNDAEQADTVYDPELNAKYEIINRKFQEIMKAIAADPKVLSIIGKRKGQRGWRELQGDTLKQILSSMIKAEEELLKDLDHLLTDARMSYPRFSFLSDNDLTDLLAHPTNRQQWIPYIRKLFPGIVGMTLALTSDPYGIHKHLDLQLHADKLEAVSVEGDLNECLKLVIPVKASLTFASWWKHFEKSVKSTVGSLLNACLASRLQENSVNNPEKILQELATFEQNSGNSREEKSLQQAVKLSFSHWLLRFPSQCVLLAEGVLWFRQMENVLASGGKEDLERVKDQLDSRLKQYTNVLQDNAHLYLCSQSRARLHILLGNLIMQTLHYKDIIQGLLKLTDVTKKCFDWQKVLKYSLDISSSILYAKHGERQEAKTEAINGYVFGACHVHQLNSSFAYDYEYLGPNLRAVTTPLTDRCHLAMVMAMKQFECGTVVGPPSSGKTESLRDLAQIMGRNILVVDCTNVANVRILSHLLSGLVQSGSWGLFENPQGMTKGLLSVFAQQLQRVFHAYQVLSNKNVVQNYETRGKSAVKHVRRHSVSTLFPSTVETDTNSVGHRSSRKKILVSFEEEVVDEGSRSRGRRHSIVKGRGESIIDHYQDSRDAVPLFINRPHPSEDVDSSPSFQQWRYKPVTLGHLKFDGHLIPAGGNFACFITMTTDSIHHPRVPSNLKSLMRPTSMSVPDLLTILETQLICSGFQEHCNLAAKLNSLSQILSAQFPESPDCHLDLRALKSVVEVAALRMYSKRSLHELTGIDTSSQKGSTTTIHHSSADSTSSVADTNPTDNVSEHGELQREEDALISALHLHFLPRLKDQQHLRAMEDLLRCVFPWGEAAHRPSTGRQEHDPVLLDAIQNQFVADKLQATPQHVNKVMELHQSLQHKCGVILVGTAGSGKTVCYQTLARVLNNLHREPPVEREEGHARIPQVPRMQGLSDSNPSPTSPSIHRMRNKAAVISRVTLLWLEVATQGRKLPEYSAVDVSVIYPATLSLDEVIGVWSEDGNSWRDGLLTRMIRDSSASSHAARALSQEQVKKAKQRKPFGKGLLSSPSIIEKWMVLDGNLNQTLSDLYHPAVKPGNRQITLGNGERLNIPRSLSLILETTDLSQASPAMVADCAILYFGRDVLHWKSLLDSWLAEVTTLWNCSNTNYQLLTTLIDEIFPSSLDFLSESRCSFVLETDQTSSTHCESLSRGLREVSTFIQILGSLFSLYFKRDEVVTDTDPEVKKQTVLLSPSVSSAVLLSPSVTSAASSRPASCNPSVLLSSMFVFSYIWGFAGHLHERYWEKFEAFAHDILSRSSMDLLIPSEGSLFDYHVDSYQGTLVSFKAQDRIKTLPSGYTVIPQMERYSHLVDLLLPTSPILLCGAPGIGKTALVQNLIHPKHPYSKLHFSPVFSQAMLENGLSSKLRPMSIALNPSLASKGVAATGGQPMFFIDDLNCCSRNSRTGGIPNLELLRQLFSQGGYYTHESYSFQSLEQFSFLSLCSPPTEAGAGVACHSLSPRLTRLVTVLMFGSLDMDSVLAMHGSSLTSWLEEFPAYSLARHEQLAKAILSATVALHNTVKRHLSCTPINPHYVFSHHDIHHVMSGLHLLSARGRGENRPKHGQRRVIGGGGGGQGRRQSQTHHGSLQQSTIAPPMMRSVIRLWCHEVTRTYTDRITSVSDMDWFSTTLQETVEQYFCCAADDGVKLAASPSLIQEEPSLCSVPSGESLSTEEIAEPREGPDSGTHSIDTFPEHQTAHTSSSTSISLHVVTCTPNSDSLDSESPSVFDGHTFSASGALDRDQQPLPPIACTTSIKEPGTEDSRASPTLKHEPRPPPGKSCSQKGEVIKEGRSSREDKMSHSQRKEVTFKPGLITYTGGAETVYSGPLITMEQLKSCDERLSDIAMSKFIATDQNSDKSKGYMECSSSQLEEGLSKVMGVYNEVSATKINLVFFQEALYHMARLSRVLATPGGNALLIGQTHSTGRTSLVRLAAFSARCKFYTCHPGHNTDENRVKLRGVMKKASQLAGVSGKLVVMLVKSRLGEPALQDLCCFLKEGTCPELYSQDELTNIVSQMLPGAKQARGSRAELALDKYFNRVQMYLHVIISMDCEDGSLSMPRGYLQRFPTLLQSVICIDVYQPWSQEAYTRVAEHWIQVPTSEPFTGKLIEPSWTSSTADIQGSSISRAMAYMHLSSHMALLQYHQQDHKIYSPATFLDFIDLFKNLTWKIIKEENVNISKYQLALDKINESLQTIQKYESEVASLRPQYQLALEIAQQKQHEVQLYQQEFADAKGHCSQDESEITVMQKPLTEMKKKAQADLDRVNPVYEAALHALRSLDSSALNEIRTFRRPPETVVKVVNALCLLFGEPYGWENGKALINRDNFFQDLEFYDKANMPHDVFHKLNVLFIQDKTFNPDYVTNASIAARSLCTWLHAVYAYALIHRNMRPKISLVEEAEVKLHEAQSHLGQKRVKAKDVQGLLDEKVKEYQECLVHVHNLDRAMKSLEDQIAEASHLMMNMDAQHVTWRSALEQARNNLSTSAGDALMAAACTTYHGPMEQSIRNDLMADWMKACQSGQFHLGRGTIAASLSKIIPIRSDFTLEAILSSKEEQQSWDQRAPLEDPHATHNALFIRACTIALKRHWPLLLDPNDQALTWIKLLQESGMVSYHEGPDSDQDLMRVESVSEKEVQEVRETRVKGQEDEEEVPDDSTDRESSTLTGTSAEYPETLTRTLTSSGPELSVKTSLLGAIPVDDSETDIFSSSHQSADKICLATIQQDTRKPPLELLVVTSDDPSLPVKLCQSVVMGYTLVVTHIERAPLTDHFRDILKRNVTMGTDGLKKVLIGSKEYPYNPKFKLLLCSSVTLDMKGADLRPLPVRDTLLINMAVDQKGLQDILMCDVLSSERPEFKNQHRSIREDIRDQRMTIAQVEEEILKKILQLPGSILEEESMLDSLRHYQEVVLTTEITLQESITLQNQLLEKQKPFIQVSHHGTLLYRTIQKLHRLHPAYYVPRRCFLEWFRAGVRSRKKDPTNIAAPRARAVELMNNLTWHVHRWIMQWCFPLHGSLFTFMFAIEKMKDADELTKEEWKMFVGGMKPGERIEGEKPDWLDEKVWSACYSLESIHPAAFSGLGKCLGQYSKQWREYFEHQPVLLSPVPGNILANLSVFQKAILWRIVRPDKVASFCHDVIIYQLGSSVATPGHLSLDTLLPVLSSRKPLLCLLPGLSHPQQDCQISGLEGNLMVHPSDEIERLCIHKGVEKQFHKVTLGTPQQLQEATRLLQDCQLRGHWLLLDNCHAVEKWDDHFLKQLKLLLETADDEDTLESGGSPWDQKEHPRISRPVVHDNFRLFMVMEADHTNKIPGLILQHGVKKSYSSTNNFKESLRFHFNQANSWLESKQVRIPTTNSKLLHEMSFCLAFFHTVLSHRLLYPGLGFRTDYSWDEKDLHSALDYLVISGSTVPLNDFSDFIEMVGTHIYGGRTSNPEDLRTVKALAKSTLIPWRDIQQMPSSMGVGSLLGSTLSCPQSMTRTTTKAANLVATLQQMFDSMKDNIDPLQLGLIEGAPSIIERRQSSFLLDSLIHLEFEPHPAPGTEFTSERSLVSAIYSKLHGLHDPSDHPDTDKLSHISSFIRSELQLLSDKVKFIMSDLELLDKALDGEIYLNPTLETILQAISHNVHPQGWGYHGVCKNQGPEEFVEELTKKIELLKSYQEKPRDVVCFDIAAFLRPKRFIKALMMEHARREFMEVQDVMMEVQIMPFEDPPSQPPEMGVYVSSFYLHNASWDTHRATMVTGDSHLNNLKSLPVKLPLMWLKPVHKHFRAMSATTLIKSEMAYGCPVYECKELIYQRLEPLMYLSIPCTLATTVWDQKQVYVTLKEP